MTSTNRFFIAYQSSTMTIYGIGRTNAEAMDDARQWANNIHSISSIEATKGLFLAAEARGTVPFAIANGIADRIPLEDAA